MKPIYVLIILCLITLSVGFSLTVYLGMLLSERDASVDEIGTKELEDKTEFLENKPNYELLETELKRVNNENQELTSILSDVIEACNKASNESHQRNNNSLEKEIKYYKNY